MLRYISRRMRSATALTIPAPSSDESFDAYRNFLRPQISSQDTPSNRIRANPRRLHGSTSTSRRRRIVYSTVVLDYDAAGAAG